MKQEVKLVVPTDWSAITLKQYLDMRKDMESYKDNEEAVFACILHHLCGFPVQYIQQMDIDTYINVKKDVSKFLGTTELPLKRFITIDGVEWGFEPDLSKMAYGAYVDISKYESVGIDDKWAEIMSILYRPVTQKLGALYDIKKYDGNVDGNKFLNVTMDIHLGALFFLIGLQKDLLRSTLKSLTGELMGEALPLKLRQILQENGKDTQLSFNLPTEISLK